VPAIRKIMAWARSNGYVVFTHDLDFGTALALTHAAGPSVLQMRTQDVLPAHAGPVIAASLRQHESDLAAGALVVVDEARSRVRILPL
jgi:predicted nuclease of predicted toxin-antitoxin system